MMGATHQVDIGYLVVGSRLPRIDEFIRASVDLFSCVAFGSIIKIINHPSSYHLRVYVCFILVLLRSMTLIRNGQRQTGRTIISQYSQLPSVGIGFFFLSSN